MGHEVPMQEYDPQSFFAANWWRVTYKGNLKWQLYHPNVGEVNEDVHINVSSLNTSWDWTPIQNEYVDIETEALSPDISINKLKSKRIHWSRFPEQTRVGWRGPMMLWDYLSILPNVYYKGQN